MPDGALVTWTGARLDPFDPDPRQFRLADIAHALAILPRFGGHTPKPYSVAQHSVYACRQLMQRAVGTSYHLFGAVECAERARLFYVRQRRVGLVGLLHDAAEAYLRDVPRPQKRHDAFAAYREAEARLQRLIYCWAGLGDLEADSEIRAQLAEIDDQLAWTEIRDLLAPAGDGVPAMPSFAFRIRPWSWQKAERLFLSQYKSLTA
jgi:hypothetical protein